MSSTVPSMLVMPRTELGKGSSNGSVQDGRGNTWSILTSKANRQMQDSSGLDEEQKAQEDSGNALESLAAVERRNADTPMLAALAEQKSTHSSQQ